MPRLRWYAFRDLGWYLKANSLSVPTFDISVHFSSHIQAHGQYMNEATYLSYLSARIWKGDPRRREAGLFNAGDKECDGSKPGGGSGALRSCAMVDMYRDESFGAISISDILRFPDPRGLRIALRHPPSRRQLRQHSSETWAQIQDTCAPSLSTYSGRLTSSRYDGLEICQSVSTLSVFMFVQIDSKCVDSISGLSPIRIVNHCRRMAPEVSHVDGSSNCELTRTAWSRFAMMMMRSNTVYPRDKSADMI
nr:hypothetical protein CFP56_11784 [Quercus suber]